MTERSEHQSDGTNTLHFYYDSNDEIIGFTYNELDYFYVKNAMSDIIGIVDDSGNLITSYAYDADNTGDGTVSSLEE